MLVRVGVDYGFGIDRVLDSSEYCGTNTAYGYSDQSLTLSTKIRLAWQVAFGKKVCKLELPAYAWRARWGNLRP